MRFLVYSILMHVLLFANLTAKELQVNQDANKEPIAHKKSILDDLLTTIELGTARIMMEHEESYAFHFASKTAYKPKDYITYYFITDGNYFNTNKSELYELGFGGIGMSYDLPVANRKVAIGASIGLGSSINSERIFQDFRNGFDLGFAYRVELNYQFDRKWSAGVSYIHYDLNTNVTHLKDTKPQLISFAVIYSIKNIWSLFSQLKKIGK